MIDAFLSRRRFIGSTGAAAAGLWAPRSVRADATTEAAHNPEIGTSKWDLDTPVLCVDLAKLEQNLATMQETVTRNGIASRPHAKTHKCPAIARLQIASGALGICTAKVSEAEVMFEYGIDGILLTTSNITAAKIGRAMNLRKAVSRLHSGNL